MRSPKVKRDAKAGRSASGRSRKKKQECLSAGIDIGGSTIKLELTTEDGTPLNDAVVQVPTEAELGPRRTIKNIISGISELLERYRRAEDELKWIGLDWPAPGNPSGVIRGGPNLKHPEWTNFNFRSALSKRYPKRRFVFENDVNAAAFGEYRSLNENLECFVMLNPGTGFGGGGVINGSVLSGVNNCAAEVGHVSLPFGYDLFDDFPTCGCGRKFCYETVVSIKGLDHQLRILLAKKRYKKHSLHKVPDTGYARAMQLRTLAGKGDGLAIELFSKQAQTLGLLIAELRVILDPTLIRIGGGLAEGAEKFKAFFLQKVIDVFHQKAFAGATSSTRIEWAVLGDRASALGVAWKAIQSGT